MNQSSSGLSLLEVIFSLTIIAVILAVVVHYFYDNQLNLQVSKAATQIQQLASVSYEWQTAQSQKDFSGISIDALQAAGLLEKNSDYTGLDPWGGHFVVSADADNPHYVQIALPSIPESACNNLREKMKNLAHAQASDIDCSQNNYFVSL